MESKKDKFSRPRDTMKDIIGDQGEQTPHLSKRYKASRPSSSMEDIIGETCFMESKKKFSRPRDTRKNIIGDQGEKTLKITKRHKASRPSSSMEDIIGEQEEQTPQLTKNYKVSWHDSMEDIIGELEEIASSPCQMSLAPQWVNHEGSTSKKKRGPTKCLKTHGLRYEDRFPVKLNVLGQPIGHYRATLSNYLGTLARNAHFAPLIYTSWKGLKENWEDMWQTVT
ncbi:hypothetical protein SESBI_47782, partial [Sesbania bispinosa]